MTRDNAIRIFSVIDDEDTRTLVERTLRYNDMLVTSCDGVGFLPHVRRNKLDLIILDMRRRRGEREQARRQNEAKKARSGQCVLHSLSTVPGAALTVRKP